MSFEPEPSVEDWGGLQQQRGGAYVREASVSTEGGDLESQPLLEVPGAKDGGAPYPETGRPGLPTSRNVEPAGSIASTRSATATFSLMSPPLPSRSSRPDRRWKTSSSSVNEAEVTRRAN